MDVRQTDTAKLADRFIQVQPNGDYELLTALRTAINGEQLEQDTIAGVPVETVEEIAVSIAAELVSVRAGRAEKGGGKP